MVPLGTGVAYCAGDEWSEVLTGDDVTTVNGSGNYVFLPSDYEAPVTIIEKVLECGEAVALLVGGDEQSGL